jgi:hypothetical protein
LAQCAGRGPPWVINGPSGNGTAPPFNNRASIKSFSFHLRSASADMPLLPPVLLNTAGLVVEGDAGGGGNARAWANKSWGEKKKKNMPIVGHIDHRLT